MKLWQNAGFINNLPDINISFSEDGFSFQSQVVDTSPIEYEVGDWVVVQYNGSEYPGEITDILANEVVVSSMHRAGNFWKWPNRKDEIVYRLENVVTKIGNRGQFLFKYFS